MSVCSVCGKQWPDGVKKCPQDGTALAQQPSGMGEFEDTEIARSPPTMAERPSKRNAPSAPPVARGPALAQPSATAELESGLMVGEYRIEQKIGEGGMATVYSAVHPLIGKKAAIKVMSHQLSTDAEAIKRFRQEARAVNQIGHMHIVDIFSFGNLADGRSYFVMELLQGESLAARMTRQRLSLAECVEILEQICDIYDLVVDTYVNAACGPYQVSATYLP